MRSLPSQGLMALLVSIAGCGSGDDAGSPVNPDGGSGDDGSAPAVGEGGSSTEGGGVDGGTNDASLRGDSGVDGGSPSGLHVVNGTGGAPGHIVDGSGNIVQLHGADRSGTEFACTYGSFSDGPVDQAGIDAMKAWHINSVRVPLNEDCWLGINGVPTTSSGAPYRAAIESWVGLLTQNGLVAVVDMHWTAPGTTLAKSQAPMADADHTPAAWSQIAKTFAGNSMVVFDLFNEPFITDWSCWVSGGMCGQYNGATYAVAGMASLLKTVRTAGAQNVVILGGLGYSSDMSQWVASVQSMTTLAAPLDGISISNVAASWHAYDFNSTQSGCPSQYNGYSASLDCNTAQTTAMNTSATSVLAAGFPVVIGETGISAYSSSSAMPFSAVQITDLETWLDGLLTWAEGQGQGYLAWSWNTDTTPVLITAYTGTPTLDFGVTYRAHLAKF